MMFLDQVLEEPDQKGQVESAKYDAFFTEISVFGRFSRNRIFLLIRIRTQKKKSDPDPDKRTGIRNTDCTGT